MTTNMIHFPSILAFTARSIFIRFIDYNFHTAASAFAFITALFLFNQKDVCYECFSSSFFVLLSVIVKKTQSAIERLYWLTAIIYSWAIRYSSTVNGNGILYSLINIFVRWFYKVGVARVSRSAGIDFSTYYRLSIFCER